jgi:hypothetical protein
MAGSISGLTAIGTWATIAGKREDPGMRYVEQNLNKRVIIKRGLDISRPLELRKHVQAYVAG